MSITNNSKRKSRIPNNTNNRPKPTRVRPKGLMERNIALEGVYNNARFMHAAACSVGCIVHVQVGNGNIYEGVFSTFSQDLDIVLEMVNRVDRDMSKVAEYGAGTNSILSSFDVEDCVAEKMIFKLSDIVSTCAASIDLDYATKDGFTDTAISKFSGPMPERELEPWQAPAEEIHNANSLDGEEETKGWDANEMFRTNAEKYNVKSTYDSSLQGYTIPLEPKNTDEYKKQEAKASKIAQEIENNPSYKQRINVENGDEEDKYSAVLRPVDNTSGPGNRYPTPNKKPIPGGGGGANKVLRSPMSPYPHSNKQGGGVSNMNSVTPTHSYSKNNVPTPPSSLPIIPITMNAPKTLHHPIQIPNAPPQQGVAPPLNMHYIPNLPARAMNHSVPPPTQQLLCQEQPNGGGGGGEISDKQQDQMNSVPVQEGNRFQDENIAPTGQDSVSSNKTGEKRRDIDKKGVGRDEQIAEFKKFSSDFKLSEDHRAPNDPREDGCATPPSGSKLDKGDSEEPGDTGTPDSDSSKLSDTIKKHILNPNAKAFTPRAVPAATPPIAPLPPRMHSQSPVVAVPQHQLVQGLGQPIFTAMAQQYMMPPNPGTMSLTPPFAPGNQPPRYRKTGPMGQQDFSPSVHVAAATGQPILTPAGIPTQQLAVQYNPAQGMMGGPSPHQAMTYSFYRYPAMVGPRVVSPQPVSSYGEVFMPHPGNAGLQVPHSVSVSAVQSMVPQGNPGGPHSNQQNQQNQGQCTPMHTAPSPVHQQGGQQTPHGTPSQTPTPTGHQVTVSTPQSVVYHSQMGPATMQGGLHNPNVPTSQAMQLHASHLSQGHPHPHHANFAAAQHVVLMHQQAVPTHGPHPASMNSSGPHSLQGHAIHGQASNHLGNPQHVLSHAPMTVIPTSAAMVHSMGGNPFAPHPHQGRDRGRQHTGNR